ncbi:MAG: Deoxyuridine 5'-triphosphate nucleotidohydrolase [Firmicutes bacterium ADurb.Bin419]|nr:MAG: Deoxyuridine 5'-triphosphate nucleotidohydrolase [Firmicutes bacterium ADurb.Bin419]
MEKTIIKVKRLSEFAKLPEYAHEGDAGLDLFSTVDAIIPAGESKLITTDISLEMESGFEAQIRPRSGLALKSGITVLNTPGTIDSGYRGPVGVIIINHSKVDFEVVKGMKIAQMVIARYIHADIIEVSDLTDTERAAGGFGSTGVK